MSQDTVTELIPDELPILLDEDGNEWVSSEPDVPSPKIGAYNRWLTQEECQELELQDEEDMNEGGASELQKEDEEYKQFNLWNEERGLNRKRLTLGDSDMEEELGELRDILLDQSIGIEGWIEQLRGQDITLQDKTIGNITFGGRSYTVPDDKDYPNYINPIDEILAKYKVLVSCSVKGTGKSHQIRKYVRAELEKNPRLRVLDIGSRISLTIQMVQALNASIRDLMVECMFYKNKEKGTFYFEQMLSIQIDSLLRILKDGAIPSYDIVILDEWIMLMDHLNSDLLTTRRKEILRVLREVIRSAKKVIIADAHFDQGCLEDLSTLLGGMEDQTWSVFIDVFRKKLDPNTYRFTGSKDVIYWYIQKSVRKDRKIAIACNSLLESWMLFYHLNRLFPEKRIMLVNGNTATGDHREHLLNADNWNLFDIVIFTTVIIAGFSFDPDGGYFDELFMIINDMINTYLQMLQMGLRIRKLLLERVTICMTDRQAEPYIPTTVELHDELVKWRSKMERKGVLVTSEDDEERKLILLMERLFIHNRIHHLKSRRSFKKEFIAELKKNMIDPEQVYDLERPKNIESFDRIRNDVKTYLERRVWDANEITEKEYKILEKKKNPNMEEKEQMSLYLFMEFFKITDRNEKDPEDETGEKLLFDFAFYQNHHRITEQLLAFEQYFLLNDVQLAKEDKNESIKKKPDFWMFYEFISESKDVVTKILRLLKFDLNQAPEYKLKSDTFLTTTENSQMVSLLNQVKVQRIKSRLESATSSKNLCSILRIILNGVGLSVSSVTDKTVLATQESQDSESQQTDRSRKTKRKKWKILHYFVRGDSICRVVEALEKRHRNNPYRMKQLQQLMANITQSWSRANGNQHSTEIQTQIQNLSLEQ